MSTGKSYTNTSSFIKMEYTKICSNKFPKTCIKVVIYDSLTL